MASLKRAVAGSREVFIRHFNHRYDEALPPIWALVEVMSIGQLSRWIANMRHGRDRNRLAREYGMDETNLISFLHHLSVVRNLCAHHNRLWNREFTFTFKLPRKTPQVLAPVLNRQTPRKLYNTLVMLVHLMDVICPDHHFRFRLDKLLHQYHVDEQAMGFPRHWKTLPFWQLSGDHS